MKRLWTVDIETSVVVWAEGREQAEKIAERELGLNFCDSSVAPTEKWGLPPDWDDLRPYGADKDDERTCLEIIREERAAAEKRAARDAHPKLEIEA